ncbi:MAG: DUF4920 domain-containing protein [Ignavibacteriaceae bacterium]|nr:DUF4920 domain-containing protein [Ignavibacteriaceae bacterium]
MKQLLSVLVLILFVFTSLNAFTLSGEGKKFGEQITMTEKTKISDILADPESFVGKKVLVEGEVVDVCSAAGCWMELKSDKDGKIKIKVKDGDIVFPMEAAGKNALVEGLVYKIDLDHESAIEYMQHLAEDAGKDFDPATVTGPMVIYQIKGIGAEIADLK